MNDDERKMIEAPVWKGVPEPPSWKGKRPIRIRFGERLCELRLSRGYTQVQLAILAGIDRSYYSDIERGIKSPTLDYVEKLADALSLTVSELTEGI
jgi:DNA-binding XRE family transcriptional regulator